MPEQKTRWNGPGGNAWVQTQGLLDGLFAPIERLLTESVPAGTRSVLDVGCGTGGTTVAIGRALGDARCVGVDVSGPMIDAARARAAAAEVDVGFVRADVQDHTFEPGTFDRIVSRFGVMFFDDPVRAFSGLRHAAADGAGLHLIAWRGPDENPFMTTAERAAAPYAPTMKRSRAGVPGQFGLADARRVHALLDDAGWSRIDVRPVDFRCTLPGGELDTYVTHLGQLGLVFDTLDPQTQRDVLPVVRSAFTPFLDGDDHRFTAACWSITAHATDDSTDARRSED